MIATSNTTVFIVRVELFDKSRVDPLVEFYEMTPSLGQGTVSDTRWGPKLGLRGVLSGGPARASHIHLSVPSRVIWHLNLSRCELITHRK